jgi:hypothetical protein
MKHRLFKLCLFLLLGAIINVAVAWSCFRWSSQQTQTARPETPQERAWLASHGERPAQLMFCWMHPSTGLGVTQYFIHLGDSGYEAQIRKRRAEIEGHDASVIYMPPRFGATRVEIGLPLPSLTAEVFVHSEDWCLRCRRPRLEQHGWLEVPLSVWSLPAAPLWPGFVVNTGVYAVLIAMLWWLFTGPFAFRQRSRIRRDLCPHCAYPVGVSPVCTECGKPLKPKQIEGRA